MKLNHTKGFCNNFDFMRQVPEMLISDIVIRREVCMRQARQFFACHSAGKIATTTACVVLLEKVAIKFVT